MPLHSTKCTKSKRSNGFSEQLVLKRIQVKGSSNQSRIRHFMNTAIPLIDPNQSITFEAFLFWSILPKLRILMTKHWVKNMSVMQIDAYSEDNKATSGFAPKGPSKPREVHTARLQKIEDLREKWREFPQERHKFLHEMLQL